MPVQSNLGTALRAAMEQAGERGEVFVGRTFAGADFAEFATLAQQITPATRVVLQEGRRDQPGPVLTLSELAADVPPPVLEDAARLMVGLAGADPTLRLAMAAASECRMDTPFAPLTQIRHADGSMSWCCTHASGPHCSPV